MNRIILIGNGFDMAHGMNTSYQNFIDNYWEKVIIDIKNNYQFSPFDNDEISILKCPESYKGGNTFEAFSAECTKSKIKIIFKNKFLKIITEKLGIQNWVDVENEYYLRLKMSYNKKQYPVHEFGAFEVQDLNQDFENIKLKLKEYLNFIECGSDVKSRGLKISPLKKIGHKIYHPFKLKDFSEASIKHKAQEEYDLFKKNTEGLDNGGITPDELMKVNLRLIKRINSDNPLSQIQNLLKSENAINYFDLIPEQTLLLNFNYTITDSKYSNPNFYDQLNEGKFTDVHSIHIHGSLNEHDKNPIIFGFGDEIDQDYMSIERLNDNRYLENIKSINYLESNNYKRLLEFVNSDNYQIFIFGHSCGTSDRTLLNTIFEHDNCASLKVFYHQKTKDFDNYSDIVRNISRNFNDKAKMRDRVVNKSYCEALI